MMALNSVRRLRWMHSAILDADDFLITIDNRYINSPVLCAEEDWRHQCLLCYPSGSHGVGKDFASWAPSVMMSNSMIPDHGIFKIILGFLFEVSESDAIKIRALGDEIAFIGNLGIRPENASAINKECKWKHDRFRNSMRSLEHLQVWLQHHHVQPNHAIVDGTLGLCEKDTFDAVYLIASTGTSPAWVQWLLQFPACGHQQGHLGQRSSSSSASKALPM